MARIQGYPEDDVDLLIADFEKVVFGAIERTCQAAANNLKPAVTSAASSAGLGPEDVAIVTSHWQEEIDGVMTPYIAEVYSGSATHVAIGLGEAFPDDLLPGIPLVADDFTLTYMKTVTSRLVGVGDELWEEIRGELLDGVNEGLSIPQISDRIAAISSFQKTRATTIARTEVHGAAESGSIAQMRFVGYADDEVTKEWLSTHDMRTRLTHSLASGQIVNLNEKFLVGGHLLDFPGDPSGPADEVIQCRCSQAFEVIEAPKFRCGGVLVAASPQSATECIVPTGPEDISFLTAAFLQKIFNTFMKHKITPAYGGAKIHKILQLVRKDLSDTGDEAITSILTDRQLLAAVDKYYVAAKDSFTHKFDVWAASPAGKKAIGVPKAPIKAVKTDIHIPTSEELSGPGLDAKILDELEKISPLGSGDLGDISQIMMNQKFWIEDKFIAANGGKKVTPAWGGAKIYKLIKQMREDDDIHGLDGYTDLQILRVLDEIGGFNGKPKTYVGEVTKWLDTPGSTKVLLKVGMPDKSLTKAPITTPATTPSVTPIQPVQSAVVDEATEALATGAKASSDQILGMMSLYKNGDTIAYGRLHGSPGGTKIKLEKTPGPTHDEVQIYVQQPNGSWSFGDTFDQSSLSSLKALVKDDEWSLLPSPIAAKTPTHIPGKMPGDVVTLDEIEASRFLWSDGDVIGTSSQGSIEWRVTSQGDGGVTFEYRYPGDADFTAWAKSVEYFPGDKIFHSITDWKLTGDVLAKKTSGAFPGMKAGQVATPDFLWANPGLGDAIAYAWEPNYSQKFYRLTGDPIAGTLKIEERAPGESKWKFSAWVNNKNDLEAWHLDWRVAKANGGMPDEVSAQIALPPSPAATPTGSITSEQIFAQLDSYADGDVIAVKTPGPSGLTQDTLTLVKGKSQLSPAPVVKVYSAGPGHPSKIVDIVSQADHLSGNWSSVWESVTKVKLTDMSHIPGKALGDELHATDIWDGAQHFTDFEIIANGENAATGWKYRIYWVDSEHLVIDKMDPDVGGWEFGWLVHEKSSIPGNVKWVTVDKKVPAQAVSTKEAKKAAKKAAPSKAVTHAPPVKATPTPTPPSAPKKQMLTGTSTHVPGKSVGDEITRDEILDNKDKYVDGQVIATRKSSSWQGDQYFRLFMVDGHLVEQKQTKAGSWAGTKIIANKYHMSAYTKWTAQNDHITAPQLKAANKQVAKLTGNAAPSIKKTPPGVSPPAAVAKPKVKITKIPDVAASSDISQLPEESQLEIFVNFKGASTGQLLSSNDEDVVSLMWALSELMATSDPARFANLTIMQIATVVDKQLAKKMGKADAHLFATKVKNFLQTQAGKDYISSGKFATNPLVDDVFDLNLHVPKGVTLKVGQRVQDVPGPGSFDPDKPRTDFKPLTAQQHQDMQDRMNENAPWTAQERDGLRTYTSGAYHSYNNYLRNLPGYSKADASVRSKILHTQAGMRPTISDMLVARGTSWEQFPEGFRSATDVRKLIGRTIEDPAFLSTSSAAQFGGFGGSVKLEIEVPKGTMAAFVKRISYNKQENELLLAAGLKYHVISVRTDGYQTVVRLRVVS